MDLQFYREYEALKNLVLVLEQEIIKLKGEGDKDSTIKAIKN